MRRPSEGGSSFVIGPYGPLASLNSLSLYIHIPFCVSRCRYCDFYSEIGQGGEMMRTYLDALLSSLDAGLERYQPRSISTIFIGGGTPSLLPRKSLSKFLQELERRTGPAAEFTIEANPESLDDAFLDVLSDSTVGRISMGVQTYDEGLLKWLGRPSGSEALDRADELLIGRWKGRINRDLLAALPRNPGGLDRDISQAVERGSDHISLYELTVEHGTPLAGDEKSLKELPDESVSLE
ncbi:MAG: radical SAM protein, partial [Spirochaetaceae bacterium]|nr:radical SAM protein [Spirochaetaceae bacterium]